MIAESVEALEAEILRHALRVAAEEASIVVVKSAHSAMIVEVADACAGILDRQARLVALSTATNLMHAASLRCSLPAILEDYPEESMQPGDVFVMNDCFRGGIHANDLLVFRPVWTEGRLSFFTGTLIHVADLGGSSAGGIVPGATDVFAEGLQLPPVRLYHAGVRVEEVHRILALNKPDTGPCIRRRRGAGGWSARRGATNRSSVGRVWTRASGAGHRGLYPGCRTANAR